MSQISTDILFPLTNHFHAHTLQQLNILFPLTNHFHAHTLQQLNNN